METLSKLKNFCPNGKAEKMALQSRFCEFLIKEIELKDKHISIFFQKETTHCQADSHFESCTEMASLKNTLNLNYLAKMPLKGRTS